MGGNEPPETLGAEPARCVASGLFYVRPHKPPEPRREALLVAFPAVRRRSLADGRISGRAIRAGDAPAKCRLFPRGGRSPRACLSPRHRPSSMTARAGVDGDNVRPLKAPGISILKSADFDGGAEGCEDERVSIRPRRYLRFDPDSPSHPRRHPDASRDPVHGGPRWRWPIGPIADGRALSVHVPDMEPWVPAFAGMTAGGLGRWCPTAARCLSRFSLPLVGR